jgi:hypothetical protein
LKLEGERERVWRLRVLASAGDQPGRGTSVRPFPSPSRSALSRSSIAGPAGGPLDGETDVKRERFTRVRFYHTFGYTNTRAWVPSALGCHPQPCHPQPCHSIVVGVNWFALRPRLRGLYTAILIAQSDSIRIAVYSLQLVCV